MEKPFPAYRGSEPYIFVCYAHEDSNAVYPELERLKAAGVNIWYDEGISPGEEWTDEIAAAIRKTFKILYFVSENSIASRHCRNEIQFATSRDKEMVVVYLEPTSLPEGLELSIGSVQALFKHELTPTDFRTKLRDVLVGSLKAEHTAPSAAAKHSSRRASIIGFVLAISFAAGLWWYVGEGDKRSSQSESVAVKPLTAIAVMPLEDLSPDGDHTWLANGMADELVQSLSRIQELRIPGRNSTTALRNQGAGIGLIRDSLDVGSLVEGSVTKIGDEILVVTRWIRSSDEQTLWSGRYQESSANLFLIQRAIAVDIAEAIRTELGIENIASFLNDARYETTDVRAWELYQKAAELTLAGKPEKLREGRALLQEALELDPNYVHARSALIFTDFRNPKRRLSNAMGEYQQGSRNSGIVRVLIQESIRQWDYQTAEKLLNEAATGNPSKRDLMFEAFTIARAQGRREEALELAARAARLDPLWLGTSMILGIAQLENGQPKLGIKTLERAIRNAEKSGQGYNLAEVHLPLAVALHRSGRTEEAMESLIQSVPEMENAIRQGYEKGGWEGMNLAMANIYTEKVSFCNAPRFADAQEPDKMYECLVQWVTGDNGELAKYVPVHLSFDSYRQEPRFKVMADRFQARIQQSAGSFLLGLPN